MKVGIRTGTDHYKKECIEKLNGFDWFSNCGNTIPENLGLEVKSAEEAKKTIAKLLE